HVGGDTGGDRWVPECMFGALRSRVESGESDGIPTHGYLHPRLRAWHQPARCGLEGNEVGPWAVVGYPQPTPPGPAPAVRQGSVADQRGDPGCVEVNLSGSTQPIGHRDVTSNQPKGDLRLCRPPRSVTEMQLSVSVENFRFRGSVEGEIYTVCTV